LVLGIHLVFGNWYLVGVWLVFGIQLVFGFKRKSELASLTKTLVYLAFNILHWAHPVQSLKEILI